MVSVRSFARPAPGARSIPIHALSAGGGTLALSPMPGSGGDYRGDLDHIAAWAPAFVVTLVTQTELAVAGIADLGQDLRDKGTRWLHLPLNDMGVPDEGFLACWSEASTSVRRALLGGGRVLVHCRAGCGRSGMVALRLMIEAGEAADEALERLRVVRPCAVETEAQMRWALAAPRAPARFLRHRDGRAVT